MRALHAAVAAMLTALVLAACTSTPSPPDPDPTPTAQDTAPAVPDLPGDRVAIVIGPTSLVAPAEASALAAAGEALAEEPPDGVADVRVTRAESQAFARDIADLAVDDGYDLVCMMGTGMADLVLDVARARRDGRFCTNDVRVVGGPVNVVAAAVDPLGLIEVGAAALGEVEGPAGLLLSAQLGEPEPLAEAFTSAARVAPPPPPPSPSPPPPSPSPPPPSPSPSTSPSATTPSSPPDPVAIVTGGAGSQAQVTAAGELTSARPSHALVLTTPGGAEATAAVADAGIQVVAVADWAVDDEGELPSNLLAALTVDWQQVLEAAVVAARDPESSQLELLGLADGALGVAPGVLAASPAAARRATAVIDGADAE